MGKNSAQLSIIGIGCLALVGGGIFAMSPLGRDIIQNIQTGQSIFSFDNNAPISPKAEPTAIAENGALAPLLKQPPEQRTQALTDLANTSDGITKNRARYLLAVDAIAQNRPTDALKWLENLDNEYGVLANHIAVLRLQASEMSGDSTVGQQWRSLLAGKGDNSLIKIEANYALRQENSDFWDAIIVPSEGEEPEGSSTELDAKSYLKQHPKTIAVVKERLQANPDNPALLSHLVNYAPDDPNIGTYLVQLEKRHGDRLTSEDWEAIGLIYWRKFQYRQAGEAYRKATSTPQNAYRAGRGLQLGKKRDEAIAAYRKAIQTFPDAPETGEARIKLASLLPSRDRINFLTQTIQQFPHLSGEATALQADAFDDLGSPQTAAQLRQKLLQDSWDSEAAATLRWKTAWSAAQNNQLSSAIRQVQALVSQAPTSELAPRAGFWLGKWLDKTNNLDGARQAYQLVLKNYPESYYAWRSASQLGLPVGDFSTVRQLRPKTQIPQVRSPLPIDDPVLQELYQLHQDQAAWEEWKARRNQRSPSIAEQFVDGTMRVKIGDYLNGIFLISNLAWRDLPEEKADYKQLSQTDAYWYALYPFPYAKEITVAAQNRNFHPMLVTGLIRQESRFEKDIESVAGALGLMQVLPTTGDWGAKEIGLGKFDLRNPTDNLALGTWFLDYTHQEYDGNSMYAIASYNAGPGNIAKWIKRFNPQDLDEFVEKIPFPETRNYVKAVLGNYWNYVRLYDAETQSLIAGAVGQ
ncbi:MAG: transglycosylase SLT domain-containing protein [Cyanobacteria bacterium P01_C01_bin.89]